ncbi:MAG: DUF559 domain-containing protein [Alteripontixanthobacter sp.]
MVQRMVGRYERNTKRAKELRNTATPAERHLWKYLSRSQIGVKFSRQMPVGPFFADFLCRSHRLIIEVDGFSHDADPGRDLNRDAYLQHDDYTVLHFSNEDVMSNTEGVIDTIRLAIAALPTPGPSRMREGRP